MELFKSLTHRPFALLWSGQAISRLGDSLYRITIAWWVLEKSGSATTMSMVLIFSFTPMLLFVLIGGVVVDRLPRVKMMLTSDLVRGTVVLVVAFLAYAQILQIWHVYVMSAIFGLVDAFFQPAYTATVPDITPYEFLPSANSLTNLSGQVANIIGPTLGAFIIGLGGTPAAFALNGLSFFVSVVCLIPLLRLSAPPTTKSLLLGVINDLREGFDTVLASTWLWITITVAALSNITYSGPFIVALPFLVKDNLHANIKLLGLLYTMAALGSVIAAVWLGKSVKIRHRGITAYWALITSGLAILILGLPISTFVALLAALIHGLTIAIFGLIWTNTLQELVPSQILGRVSSIDYLGSYVFLPIGYGIAGWAIDQIGAPLVFVLGGSLTTLLAVLGLAHPEIRNLD